MPHFGGILRWKEPFLPRREEHTQPSEEKSLPTKILYSEWERTPKTRTFAGIGQENKHSRQCPQPLKINALNKKIKAFKTDI